MKPPCPVAYLIDDLGPRGAQRQLLELVLRLDPSRFSPSVYHYVESEGFFCDQLKDAGIPVKYIEKTPGFSASFPLRLSRELFRERDGIVHAYLGGSNLYAALAALPLPGLRAIASERSNLPERKLKIAAGEAVSYKLADLVIANSYSAAARIAKRYRIASQKIIAIPNGVDIDRFADNDRIGSILRKELGIANDEKLLAMVGAMTPEKNHLAFFEALGKVAGDFSKKWKLLIVGGRPDKALEDKCRNALYSAGLGASFHFMDPVADIEKVYAAADVVALASKYEGCPNVVLEAMASGKTVVASSVSDIPLMLGENGSELLFAHDDLDSIGQVMLRLDSMTDEILYEKGLANARRVSDSYGMENMVNTTQQQYDKLIGNVDGNRE